MVLRKSFYIRWSAGRSPRVHEVNPGRDPSEGASHDASREACASLEDGVLARRPPNADGVVGEAPLETVVEPSFLAKLANTGPRRPRLSNQLILGSYVLP